VAESGVLIPRGLKPRRGTTKQRRFGSAGSIEEYGFWATKSPGVLRNSTRDEFRVNGFTGETAWFRRSRPGALIPLRWP
jgi:hypothetical protein